MAYWLALRWMNILALTCVDYGNCSNCSKFEVSSEFPCQGLQDKHGQLPLKPNCSANFPRSHEGLKSEVQKTKPKTWSLFSGEGVPISQLRTGRPRAVSKLVFKATPSSSRVPVSLQWCKSTDHTKGPKVPWSNKASNLRFAQRRQKKKKKRKSVGHIEQGLFNLTSNVFLVSAKAVFNCKLCENGDGKLVSILDLPGDILIIPQATLGGRLKGKSMQYHTNVNKETGEDLYQHFVNLIEEAFRENPASVEKGATVKFGTYGNRQVLSVETNGPYSHIVEIWCEKAKRMLRTSIHSPSVPRWMHHTRSPCEQEGLFSFTKLLVVCLVPKGTWDIVRPSPLITICFHHAQPWQMTLFCTEPLWACWHTLESSNVSLCQK